jgi:hypothetical protein
MKKGILLIALIVYSFTSCQEKANTLSNSTKSIINKKSDNKSNIQNTDFLKNLQDICVEDDGVFKNCDELFTKDGSSLFFIIIPKIGAKNWYNKQTENIKGEIYEVNNILIEKVKNNKTLSNEFDVWLFFIDKKYTEFVGMDSPYNFKTPRTTDLFYLRSNNNWEKLESFNVLNEKDDNKETNWRSNFINKIIDQSNSKNVISKMSNKWIGKYSTYFSYGKIGGENAGWNLEIEISNDSIIATGDGYQIGFTDLLIARERDNELVLNHLKNLKGYKLGTKMDPEFVLIENKGKYFIKTKWIDSDIVTKPNQLGYEIIKE